MTIFNFLLYVPLLYLCCGLLAFVGKRKHLLNVLLSLEFIMVNNFWFMAQAFGHLWREKGMGICILYYFFLLLLLVSSLWLWLYLSVSFVGMVSMILEVLMF